VITTLSYSTDSSVRYCSALDPCYVHISALMTSVSTEASSAVEVYMVVQKFTFHDNSQQSPFQNWLILLPNLGHAVSVLFSEAAYCQESNKC